MLTDQYVITSDTRRTTAGVSCAASAATRGVFAVASSGRSAQPAQLRVVQEAVAFVLCKALGAVSSGVREAWGRVEVAIKATVFENGVLHPAERDFARYLDRYGDDDLYRLTHALRDTQPDFFATVLRMAGRMTPIGPTSRKELVAHGLASADSDVRDAAMQAVETWGDRSLLPLLESHVEPDAWLDDFRRGVIEDLTG